MKKRMLAGMMAFIMAGMLTACGSSSSVSESAKSGEDKENKTNTGSAEDGNSGSASVVLKLGHIQSESDLWNLGAVKFADRVSELSNGDIKIEIYPNSTLGGDRDMAEGLMMGTVDISLIAGVLSNFDDTISVLEIPYLFRSNEEFEKVIYGDVGKEIAAHVLDTSGIRILNWWERGPRLITSSKPINSVADMKGLKMRGPNNVYISMFDCLGASGTTMDWNEVYTALQTKVMDGMEASPSMINSMKFQDNAKNLAVTNHCMACIMYFFNKDWYDALPEDLQQIIMESVEETVAYQARIDDEDNDKALEDMKAEGVVITEIADIDKWKEACAPMLEEYRAKGDNWNTFIDMILEAQK